MNQIENITKVVPVEFSNDKPCMWEIGGGNHLTGKSTVICGENGEMKQAVEIQMIGLRRALVPIVVGDFIFETTHKEKDFNISQFKITRIDDRNAELILINHHKNQQWLFELPQKFDHVYVKSMSNSISDNPLAFVYQNYNMCK